jgi:hypothetical protein
MSVQSTKPTEVPFASETNASGLATAETVGNTSSNRGNDHAADPSKNSEAQLAADRLYEERIEEEYAKREGGA